MILPLLKRVATLPCEIRVREIVVVKNWVKQTAVQDSICENFDYHFTANLLLSQEWKNFENRLRNDTVTTTSLVSSFWDTVHSVASELGRHTSFCCIIQSSRKMRPYIFCNRPNKLQTCTELNNILFVRKLVKWRLSATLTLNSTWILLSFKRCSILRNCCDKLSCRHADVIRDVTACWHISEEMVSCSCFCETPVCETPVIYQIDTNMSADHKTGLAIALRALTRTINLPKCLRWVRRKRQETHGWLVGV